MVEVFGNDMATGSIIVDEFWIIQVIEIIRTILPLRKCYGFKNRGRVGVVLLGLDVPKSPVFMRLSGLGTF